MVSLFPSHWRNSKKKSPCGPSRPAGTCKGTGAASILPCKKQEPSEMVRIRLTFAAGILTGAKKRPRRGRISGCLRSRWPARSTVCRGKNTSRRSGDFSGDAEHRWRGDAGWKYKFWKIFKNVLTMAFKSNCRIWLGVRSQEVPECVYFMSLTGIFQIWYYKYYPYFWDRVSICCSAI